MRTGTGLRVRGHRDPRQGRGPSGESQGSGQGATAGGGGGTPGGGGPRGGSAGSWPSMLLCVPPATNPESLPRSVLQAPAQPFLPSGSPGQVRLRQAHGELPGPPEGNVTERFPSAVTLLPTVRPLPPSVGMWGDRPRSHCRGGTPNATLTLCLRRSRGSAARPADRAAPSPALCPRRRLERPGGPCLPRGPPALPPRAEALTPATGAAGDRGSTRSGGGGDGCACRKGDTRARRLPSWGRRSCPARARPSPEPKQQQPDPRPRPPARDKHTCCSRRPACSAPRRQRGRPSHLPCPDPGPSGPHVWSEHQR